MSEPVLSARGVSRRLEAAGQGFTLHIESLFLAPGRSIAVIGPSGCGKSTLLGILGLALRPDTGDLLMLGDIDALGMWRSGDADGLAITRARMLGFVPQTAGLVPFLTVAENIALPLAMLGRTAPIQVRTTAERLGIGHLLGRYPAEVSVGQRQRVSLARALAHRPPIVLADEPTAALHPAQAADIFALLRDVASGGTAVLAGTHDQTEAAAAGFTLVDCVPEPDGSGSRVCVPTLEHAA